MKSTLSSIILFLLFAFSAIAQNEVNVPQIPITPPSEIDRDQVIDSQILATVFGYPFTNDIGAPKYFSNTNYKKIRDILLSLYKEGKLEKDQINSTIDDLYNNIKNIPINQDFSGNDGALQNKYPDLDVPKLLSMFILSARSGYIPDFQLYLRISRCNYYIAPNMLTISGTLPTEKQKEATEDEILACYPAANAIISHPDKTLPLLQAVISDNTISVEIRLRAAAFLSDMKPELLTNEIQKMNDSSYVQNLRTIQKKGFWKSNITHLLR